MKSLQFLICILLIGVVESALDVVSEIKNLVVKSGPYAGAFQLAPQGRINWYFTNLGILPVVRLMNAADQDQYIRKYLDLYISKLQPGNVIDDVNFPEGQYNPNNFNLVKSDSDDSYAATFLTLASHYVTISGNNAWLQANLQKLKDLSYTNLAKSLKSNGLTMVFQYPRNTTSVGYLMDNCEVYRGLRDFAQLLRTRNDSYGDYCDRLADSIAIGIGQLFKDEAFVAGDYVSTPSADFYPGTTCQVFPQVFGVKEVSSRFDAAWTYLNKYSTNWPNGIDAYPWAILGYAAALRNQQAQAQQMMTTVENLFVSNRARVTINELGFYQRIKSVLAGQPAI